MEHQKNKIVVEDTDEKLNLFSKNQLKDEEKLTEVLDSERPILNHINGKLIFLYKKVIENNYAKTEIESDINKLLQYEEKKEGYEINNQAVSSDFFKKGKNNLKVLINY